MQALTSNELADSLIETMPPANYSGAICSWRGELEKRNLEKENYILQGEYWEILEVCENEALGN